MYDIPGLKDLALDKLRESVIIKHTRDFLSTVEEAYNSTIDSDQGLRGLIVDIFIRTKILDQPETQAMVKSIPELEFALVMEMNKRWRGSGSYRYC